jgi:hypothetical protein
VGEDGTTTWHKLEYAAGYAVGYMSALFDNFKEEMKDAWGVISGVAELDFEKVRHSWKRLMEDMDADAANSKNQFGSLWEWIVTIADGWSKLFDGKTMTQKISETKQAWVNLWNTAKNYATIALDSIIEKLAGLGVAIARIMGALGIPQSALAIAVATSAQGAAQAQTQKATKAAAQTDDDAARKADPEKWLAEHNAKVAAHQASLGLANMTVPSAGMAQMPGHTSNSRATSIHKETHASVTVNLPGVTDAPGFARDLPGVVRNMDLTDQSDEGMD